MGTTGEKQMAPPVYELRVEEYPRGVRRKFERWPRDAVPTRHDELGMIGRTGARAQSLKIVYGTLKGIRGISKGDNK